MDVMTLVAGLVLAAGALVLILYPLWRQTRSDTMFQADQPQQMLENLEARYQAALVTIKDLILDYDMGKVSPEDYFALLDKAKLEAAQVRQQIDRLSHQVEAVPNPTLEAEIETLVTQLKTNRQDGNKALLQAIDAEIELLKQTVGGQRACPSCGQDVQADDAFCSRCGQSLTDLEVELEPDEHTCPTCSYKFQPGDVFCAQCGATLPATANQQQHEEATR